MPNHSIRKKSGHTITIDEKHTTLLEEFDKIEHETIPDLENERAELKERLKTSEADNIDKKMDMKDRIREINEQLNILRTKRKDYLLKNASYVFNYFEEKKKISVGEATNKNVLNSFFKVKTRDCSGNADIASVNSSKYKNSRQFYQNYWKNVNNEICYSEDYHVPADVCLRCNRGEMISQDEEGILICNNNKCGAYVQYIVDNDKPTYKEPPNEVTYNAYVRLNHFKEILSQFQAKETTQIPADVIETIKRRIKKERIHDMVTEINYEKMREILKKLGFNRYFEHIQYINSILGIKPPVMSDELQDTLCVLFIEIQEPWAIHCPAYRTNFFNCTYTLYQLCVLLDQTQYLPFIPMMKDREKQLEQDMVWKKVCDTLDWEFVATV
jgi:hypothetical protein